MVWSPKSATNAYLDTLKLCKPSHERTHDDACTTIEPQSNEFISALAAGMSAQLIVEVSTEASQSTVALAAAARQTGGRLVCILPGQESLAASERAINDSGLNSMVEFKTGDPYELLLEYANIDFSLVDCKKESNTELLKLLDVNPSRSMVVANNLIGEREGLGGELGGVLKEKYEVRSVKHPIGDGMEVTMIGRSDEFGMFMGGGGGGGGRKGMVGAGRRRPRGKSRWEKRIDEESGEEHIFRVPRSI